MPIGPILVHLLTGLGTVCALLATLALIEGRFETMFAWLGLALLIDGIDGPMARATHVKERLARFSGERLDLIIDYLTYVFIPTLALLLGGFLPSPVALPLAAAVLLSSLFHFSDTASKADDNSFVGFPAVWNIVAFYLFVFDLKGAPAAAIVTLCVALTFVPAHWVHPMRVVAWRLPTLAATALWSLAATASIVSGFAAVAPWASLALALTGLYFLAVPFLAGRSARR